MKKTAIVLLTFLIGVCCIGFVSCSQTPNNNNYKQSSVSQSFDSKSGNEKSSRTPVEPITEGGDFETETPFN